MELAGLEPATSWVRCKRRAEVSGESGHRCAVFARPRERGRPGITGCYSPHARHGDPTWIQTGEWRARSEGSGGAAGVGVCHSAGRSARGVSHPCCKHQPAGNIDWRVSPTKGRHVLALDHHRRHCCVGPPWLLWPGTLLPVGARPERNDSGRLHRRGCRRCGSGHRRSHRLDLSLAPRGQKTPLKRRFRESFC
jgi:hypothetical protein